MVRASPPTTLLGAIGSSAFVAVGAYLCAGSLLPSVFADPIASPSRRILVFVTGALSVLFFGFVLVYFVGRLLSFRRPILEVGPEGILDRASVLSAGFVPWEEVEDARVRRFLGYRYLGVRVRDPQALLARQGPAKRWLMGVNQEIVGTPVNVPLGALAVREDALIGEIGRNLRRG